MNHDHTFCSDFGHDCPADCFRAEITAELFREKYNGPVSWANFRGSNECKLNIPKATTGVPELLKAILETLQSIDRKMDAPYYLREEYFAQYEPMNGSGLATKEKVIRRERVSGGGEGIID